MNGKLYTIGATGTQNDLITINNSAVCEHRIDYSYDSAPTHTITFVGDVGLELCSEKKPSFEIKKVHFNDPATVVIWADGTKTVVKCGEEDIYDPQTGLLMCIAKKAFGNNGKFNDILREWVPEEEPEVASYISRNTQEFINGLNRYFFDPCIELADVLNAKLVKEDARG